MSSALVEKSNSTVSAPTTAMALISSALNEVRSQGGKVQKVTGELFMAPYVLNKDDPSKMSCYVKQEMKIESINAKSYEDELAEAAAEFVKKAPENTLFAEMQGRFSIGYEVNGQQEIKQVELKAEGYTREGANLLEFKASLLK